MTPGRTFVRRRGTTPLPNATVHDDRLSYAALGLLAVILARPESAPQGYRDLQGRGLGKDATLRALRELTECGYRHQVKRSGGRDKLVTDTVISVDPITPEAARDWLLRSPGLPGLRAAESRARTDLHKRGPSAGRIVRGVSEPDPSEPDGPPHVLRTQGDLHPSDEITRDPNACAHGRAKWQRCPECPDDVQCEHGTPRRYSACLECRPSRRRKPPPAFTGLDFAQRAAGEHLEQTP